MTTALAEAPPAAPLEIPVAPPVAPPLTLDQVAYNAAVRAIRPIEATLEAHPALDDEAKAKIIQGKGLVEGPRGIEGLIKRRQKVEDAMEEARTALHFAEVRVVASLGRPLTRHERASGFGLHGHPATLEHQWWLEPNPDPCDECVPADMAAKFRANPRGAWRTMIPRWKMPAETAPASFTEAPPHGNTPRHVSTPEEIAAALKRWSDFKAAGKRTSEDVKAGVPGAAAELKGLRASWVVERALVEVEIGRTLTAEELTP